MIFLSSAPTDRECRLARPECAPNLTVFILALHKLAANARSIRPSLVDVDQRETLAVGRRAPRRRQGRLMRNGTARVMPAVAKSFAGPTFLLTFERIMTVSRGTACSLGNTLGPAVG